MMSKIIKLALYADTTKIHNKFNDVMTVMSQITFLSKLEYKETISCINK